MRFDEHACLLPGLLRSRLPADGVDETEEFGFPGSTCPRADLIVLELRDGTLETATPEPRQTITDVDSVPGLLDEGSEVREVPQ